MTWEGVVARVPPGVKWWVGNAVGPRPSHVADEAVLLQYINHALVDLLVHGLLARRGAEQRQQGPPGPAMGADDRVAFERRVPGPDPQHDLPVVLATRRQDLPFVGLPGSHDVGVAHHHFGVGQALPFAEGYLGQPWLDPLAAG